MMLMSTPALVSAMPLRLAEHRLTAVSTEQTLVNRILPDATLAAVFARELNSLHDEIDRHEVFVYEADFEQGVASEHRATVARIWSRWLELAQWLSGEIARLNVGPMNPVPEFAAFHERLQEREAVERLANQPPLTRAERDRFLAGGTPPPASWYQ